jgi:hypothetical protein
MCIVGKVGSGFMCKSGKERTRLKEHDYNHSYQTPLSSLAAGAAYSRSARTGGEREIRESIATGKKGKRTRSGLGSIDTRATTTGGKAHTVAALQRRTR